MTFYLARPRLNRLTDFKNFWQVALLEALGLLKVSFLQYDVF